MWKLKEPLIPKSSEPIVMPPLRSTVKSPSEFRCSVPERLARPKKSKPALARRSQPLESTVTVKWASRLSTLSSETLPLTSSMNVVALIPSRALWDVLIMIVPAASIVKTAASAVAWTASFRAKPSE